MERLVVLRRRRLQDVVVRIAEELGVLEAEVGWAWYRFIEHLEELDLPGRGSTSVLIDFCHEKDVSPAFFKALEDHGMIETTEETFRLPEWRALWAQRDARGQVIDRDTRDLGAERSRRFRANKRQPRYAEENHVTPGTDHVTATLRSQNDDPELELGQENSRYGHVTDHVTVPPHPPRRRTISPFIKDERQRESLEDTSSPPPKGSPSSPLQGNGNGKKRHLLGEIRGMYGQDDLYNDFVDFFLELCPSSLQQVEVAAVLRARQEANQLRRDDLEAWKAILKKLLDGPDSKFAFVTVRSRFLQHLRPSETDLRGPGKTEAQLTEERREEAIRRRNQETLKRCRGEA